MSLSNPHPEVPRTATVERTPQPDGECERSRRVLVLSDGRPGHYKKSSGVVRAVERLGPVDLQWLDLRMRAGGFRPLLRWWWNSIGLRLPLWALRWVYSIQGGDSPVPPDLIISSGGNTLYANVWLARYFGCRNLFIGTLRGLRESCFSRVVTIDSSLADNARYIVSLLPTVVAPQDVARAARRWLSESGLPERRRWTLLVGGDGGGHAYTMDEWRMLIGALGPLAQRFGIRWLITTSRRTGPVVEDMLEQIRDEDYVDDLLIYSSDERRLFEAFLGSGEIVFSTSESSMMISEAVASGRPVFALEPQQVRANEQNRQLQQLYEDRGFLQCLPIPEFATTDFLALAAGFSGSDDEPMRALHQQVEEFLRAA